MRKKSDVSNEKLTNSIRILTFQMQYFKRNYSKRNLIVFLLLAWNIGWKYRMASVILYSYPSFKKKKAGKFLKLLPQKTFTCKKSTIETLEKGMKYV